jgi:hypothetical protein
LDAQNEQLKDVDKAVNKALDHVDNVNIQMRKVVDGVSSYGHLTCYGHQFIDPFYPLFADDERRQVYDELYLAMCIAVSTWFHR